ncbi:MAG: hypothetical protein WC140_05450 [Bacteroidales bacterium]
MKKYIILLIGLLFFMSSCNKEYLPELSMEDGFSMSKPELSLTTKAQVLDEDIYAFPYVSSEETIVPFRQNNIIDNIYYYRFEKDVKKIGFASMGKSDDNITVTSDVKNNLLFTVKQESNKGLLKDLIVGSYDNYSPYNKTELKNVELERLSSRFVFDLILKMNEKEIPTKDVFSKVYVTVDNLSKQVSYSTDLKVFYPQESCETTANLYEQENYYESNMVYCLPTLKGEQSNIKLTTEDIYGTKTEYNVRLPEAITKNKFYKITISLTKENINSVFSLDSNIKIIEIDDNYELDDIQSASLFYLDKKEILLGKEANNICEVQVSCKFKKFEIVIPNSFEDRIAVAAIPMYESVSDDDFVSSGTIEVTNQSSYRVIFKTLVSNEGNASSFKDSVLFKADNVFSKIPIIQPNGMEQIIGMRLFDFGRVNRIGIKGYNIVISFPEDSGKESIILKGYVDRSISDLNYYYDSLTVTGDVITTLMLNNTENINFVNAPDLTYLSISKADELNNLSLLNVPSLAYLQLYNPSKILSFDFSNQKDLKELEIYDCPNLTSLDFTYNEKLEILKLINDSKLRILDLSKSVNLKILDFYNDMTDKYTNKVLNILDISNCVKLEDFKLIGFPCLYKIATNNNLQNLHNFYMRDCRSLEIFDRSSIIDLYKLEMWNAKIGSILFSNQKNLSYVSLRYCENIDTIDFSRCPALKIFNMDILENPLERLDLSDCSSLEEINNGTVFPVLNVNLRGCDNLERIYFSKMEFFEHGILKNLKDINIEYIDNTCLSENVLKDIKINFPALSTFSVKSYSTDFNINGVSLDSLYLEMKELKFLDVSEANIEKLNVNLYYNTNDITINLSDNEKYQIGNLYLQRPPAKNKLDFSNKYVKKLVFTYSQYDTLILNNCPTLEYVMLEGINYSQHMTTYVETKNDINLESLIFKSTTKLKTILMDGSDNLSFLGLNNLGTSLSSDNFNLILQRLPDRTSKPISDCGIVNLYGSTLPDNTDREIALNKNWIFVQN